MSLECGPLALSRCWRTGSGGVEKSVTKEMNREEWGAEMSREEEKSRVWTGEEWRRVDR